MTVKYVDPPSGWMYGFPAKLEDNYPAQLRKAGYPERDIELAMKHSRIIYLEVDDDDR